MVQAKKNYFLQIAILNLLLTYCWGAVLVPRIQNEHFELTSMSDNQYELVIHTPDGSDRRETVKLLSPGTSVEALNVSGIYSILYPDIGKRLIVKYEAGVNGYQATVELIPEIIIEKPVIAHLSPSALKSAAG